MPGGMRAARHAFASRVAAAAAAGFDGLCLHLRDYAEQRAKGLSDADLTAILADQGLRLFGLEFLTGWDRAEGAPLEETAWRAAQGLGVSRLNIGREAGPAPRAIAPIRARFEALAERAAREGVRLALEIVPWTAAPDLASARALTAGMDNAGLVIDSWHIFRGGISLAELAAVPGAEILDIQINDAGPGTATDLATETCQRLCCGEGSLDLQGFVAALRQTGSQAPLSVEIISPALQALPVQQAARRAMVGVPPLLRALDQRPC